MSTEKKFRVSLVPCDNYEKNTVRSAMRKLLAPLGGLDFVSPGMTVAIKANLVTGAAENKAVTTHPELVAALCEMLVERGAEVIVGDSPGGLFTRGALQSAYRGAGYERIEETGAKLNLDTSVRKAVFPEAISAKAFDYTGWLDQADVIIDFSKPGSLDGLLAYAVKNRVPAVLCTTGYTEEQLRQIDETAKQVALFRSGNMSVGIALVRALIRKAATVLGDGFDVEIVETHHNRKVDAPSGTALMLYDAVKDAYDQPREAVYGRHGRDCKRQHNEIGIHALRGGTVTGEHEVSFFGASERIRISHSAENRSVFAVGALRAAEFLTGKEPGLYSMDDVVGQL